MIQVIGQSELNTLRVLAAKIKAAGGQAMRSVGHAQGERLEDVQRIAAQMETRLEQAGAERQRQGFPSPGVLATVPLVPRELLDTPLNREYRDALRVAWKAGLAVDRERYGESIGTDGCAGAVEAILADVEEELRERARLER